MSIAKRALPSPGFPCPTLAARLDRVLDETDALDGAGPDPRVEALARVLAFPGPIRRVQPLRGPALTLALVPPGHVPAARLLRRAARVVGRRLVLVPTARLRREERRRLDVALAPFRHTLPDAAEGARLVALVAGHGSMTLADLAEAVDEACHPLETVLAFVAHRRLALDPALGITPEAIVTLPA